MANFAAHVGNPASHCQWCSRPLDDRAIRLRRTVLCTGCGAATTDPVPTEPQLEAAYAEWYRPSNGRFSGPGDALLRRSRAHLARRIDRLAPPGPVLDVGAGDGALLDALAARGRDAVGLERHSRRADVRSEELSEVGGEWAAIVLWHSLEHLRDAGPALDRACALLASGGLLVIAMPNAGSLQARAFGESWFALDIPRHLVHVPATALVKRLHQRGMRVDRVSHMRGGQGLFGWLHGLVARASGHLDLYDAIRRPEAREGPLSARERAWAVGIAALLLPLAAAASLIEVVMRRGGSVYVEARRV
jgi:SAM-dependent methyltransferase